MCSKLPNSQQYKLCCATTVSSYLCRDSGYPFEELNEESEPLRLRVSWVKTKIQAFNYILEAAILSVPVWGEDIEVTERFTYLGSDIHVSPGCESDVNRRLSRACGVMDSRDHGVWCCRYLCRRTKV